MRIAAVTNLASPSSRLRSVVLASCRICDLCSVHLRQVNRTCLTVMRPWTHSQVAVVTPRTRRSHRNWLKSILPVLNWTRSALCGLRWPEWSCIYRCVTSGASLRYFIPPLPFGHLVFHSFRDKFCINAFLAASSHVRCSSKGRRCWCASLAISSTISLPLMLTCSGIQCSSSFAPRLIIASFWVRLRGIWSELDFISFITFSEAWLSEYNLYFRSWGLIDVLQCSVSFSTAFVSSSSQRLI